MVTTHSWSIPWEKKPMEKVSSCSGRASSVVSTGIHSTSSAGSNLVPKYGVKSSELAVWSKRNV